VGVRVSFLRLFRTFHMAINPTRLGFALVGLVAIYASGRILDRIWLSADQGALVAPVPPHTCRSRRSRPANTRTRSRPTRSARREFADWKTLVRSERTRLEADALVSLGKVDQKLKAHQMLTTRRPRSCSKIKLTKRRSNRRSRPLTTVSHAAGRHRKEGDDRKKEITRRS